MAQITLLDDNKIIYFDENTGNYKIFDGERWWLSDDKFGTSTKPSGVALVDSAIVDKSVVGEEERPAMVTIWEGTYTPSPHGGVYFYTTEDVQSAELLRNVPEVNVTLDGTPYTLPVVFDGGIYTIGELPNTPFTFVYDSVSEPNIVGVATLTEGSHTIKVEYTPSPEPTMQTIWEGAFSGLRYLTEDIQNASLLKDVEEVTVTFDGVVYTATVTKQTSEDVSAYTFGASDPSFSDYPFSFGWTDSRTPVITMIAQTDGEHTIKVEGDLKEQSSSENPGGGSAIDLPGGEIAL